MISMKKQNINGFVFAEHTAEKLVDQLNMTAEMLQQALPLAPNSDRPRDPVQYLIRSVEAYGFTFLDYIKVQTLLRLSWLLPGRCKAKRRQEHQPPQKCQGL